MKLKEWAFLGSYEFFTNRLRVLATNELSPEKWSYAGKDDFGILKNYLYVTFDKLIDEREKVAEDEKNKYIYTDDKVSCFNTGLYDKHWQAIYFFCIKNNVADKQEWKFHYFYNGYNIQYADIKTADVDALKRPNYFEDPSNLIYDVRLSIEPQWHHILDDEENFLRIPEQLRSMGKDFCRNCIGGSIQSLKKRIESNYKTVVLQWYGNKIQLLAPLYLTNNEKPDLALVLSLSDDKSKYYGHTCLTTEMAYNNARLIARPDSEWLIP